MKTWKVTGRSHGHGKVQIPQPQQCRGPRQPHVYVCVCVCVCVCVRAQLEDAGLRGTCSGAVQRPCAAPSSLPPFPAPGRAGHPGFTWLSLPIRPLASSQWRSHVARYEHQAPSPHGSRPPVPGDKAILHPPHSPNSVKAGPRPPTGDTVHRADALLTHPVALGSCEATQGHSEGGPAQ